MYVKKQKIKKRTLLGPVWQQHKLRCNIAWLIQLNSGEIELATQKIIRKWIQ
jgi:hypothetical protein